MLVYCLFISFFMKAHALAPSHSLTPNELLTKFIQSENTPEALQILQDLQLDINIATGPLQRTALMEAVIKGQTSLIKKLFIRRELDIHQQDINGDTIWHLAVKHNQKDTLLLILRRWGGDLNLDAINKENKTAFMLALEQDNRDTCDILTPYISNKEFRTSICNAIEKANISRFNYLKNQFVKQYEYNRQPILNAFETVLLHLNDNSDEIDIQEFLTKLNNLEIIFNQMNIYNGKQSFTEWCLRKKLRCIIHILFLDKDKDREKRKLYTKCLFKTAQNEDERELFKSLLIHLIPEYLEQQHILKLEQNSSSQKEEKNLDSYGRGPLMQVILSGDLELLMTWTDDQLLHSLKTEKDCYDNTPLMMIVAFQRQNMLEYILSRYANDISLTQLNRLGEDALTIALSKGEWSLYLKIFVHTFGRSHLYYLIKMVKKDNVKAVQYLLPFVSKDDLLKRDENGQNVLSQAVMVGAWQVVPLIKQQMDLTEFKDTTLFISCMKQNQDKILKILIKQYQLKKHQTHSTEVIPDVSQKDLDNVIQNLLLAVELENEHKVNELASLKIVDCPEWNEAYKEALTISLLNKKHTITHILIEAQPQKVETLVFESFIFPLKGNYSELQKIIWDEAFDTDDSLMIEYLLKVKKINPSLYGWRGFVEAVRLDKKKVLLTMMKFMPKENCQQKEQSVWSTALTYSFKQNKFDLTEILIAGQYAKSELLKNMNSEVTQFRNYLIQKQDGIESRTRKAMDSYPDILKTQKGLMALPFYQQLSREEIQDYLSFSPTKDSIYQREFKAYESYLLSLINTKTSYSKTKEYLLKDEQQFLNHLQRSYSKNSQSQLFAETPQGVTLIMYASYRGWIQVVRYLHKEQNMSLEKLDCNGRSALFYLCMTDHLFEIADFFKFQESLYLSYFEGLKTEKGMNFLMYSASQGALDFVIFLIREKAYKVTALSEFHFSVLDFLALNTDLKEKFSEVICECLKISSGEIEKKKYLEIRTEETTLRLKERQNDLRDFRRNTPNATPLEEERFLHLINTAEQHLDRLRIDIHTCLKTVYTIHEMQVNLGLALVSLGHKEGFSMLLDLFLLRDSVTTDRLNNTLFRSIQFMFLYNYDQMQDDCKEQIEKSYLDNFQKISLLNNFYPHRYGHTLGTLTEPFKPYLYELFSSKETLDVLKSKFLSYCDFSKLSIKEVENLIDLILIHSYLDPLTNSPLDSGHLIELFFKKLCKNSTAKWVPSQAVKFAITRILDFNLPASFSLLSYLLTIPNEPDLSLIKKSLMTVSKKEGESILNFLSSNDKYTKVKSQFWLKNWKTLKASLNTKESRYVEMCEAIYKDLLSFSDLINSEPNWFLPDRVTGSPVLIRFLKNSNKNLQHFHYLLSFCKDFANQTNLIGQTALMVAIERSALATENQEMMIQIIKELLRVSKDIDWALKCIRGRTVLHYAIHAQSLPIVQILINAGFPFHLSDFDLAFNKNPLIAQYLLDKFSHLFETKELKKLVQKIKLHHNQPIEGQGSVWGRTQEELPLQLISFSIKNSLHISA